VTDGVRKLKQNAVRLNGQLQNEIVATIDADTEFTLRAGKRMVKVAVTRP
jgi:hypothetical protein